MGKLPMGRCPELVEGWEEKRLGEVLTIERGGLNAKQKEFLEFVLSKYVETGVEELDQEKLPDLLKLKYHEISDAAAVLGGTDRIRQMFIAFQKYLYEKAA